MQEIGEHFVADKVERQHFHGAYLRSTRAVLEDDQSGHFVDSAEHWSVAFDRLYIIASDAWERGDDPSDPWATNGRFGGRVGQRKAR